MPLLMRSTVTELEKVAGQAILGIAHFLPDGGLKIVERNLAPALDHYPQNGVGIAGLDFRDVQVGAEQIFIIGVRPVKLAAINGSL